MERQRLTAKLAGLEEIVSGKYVQQGGFQSNYVLTNLGRKLSRARVLGLVVNVFASADGNFGSITLDDGLETLRVKVFVNTKIFDGITPGDLVDVIGKVREYQNDIYIVPESVRKSEPNYETLRLLELKKIRDAQIEKIKKIEALKSKAADAAELKVLAEREGVDKEDVESIIEAEELIKSSGDEKVEEFTDVKEKVLNLIETLDSGEGADYGKILNDSGLEEKQVDSAIESLLESGVCIEPRAGKIQKI